MKLKTGSLKIGGRSKHRFENNYPNRRRNNICKNQKIRTLNLRMMSPKRKNDLQAGRHSFASFNS
jgi:hypothetical protein